MSDWIAEGDISDFGNFKSSYPTIELLVHLASGTETISLITPKDPAISIEELATQAAYRFGADDTDRCFVIDIADKTGTILRCADYLGLTAADLEDGSHIYLEIDTAIDYEHEDLSEL